AVIPAGFEEFEAEFADGPAGAGVEPADGSESWGPRAGGGGGGGGGGPPPPPPPPPEPAGGDGGHGTISQR
ncbi:hypothetical protein M2317_001922, partial [Microbacterium sp. ZKA21]